jgi:hypothetical protein
MILILASLVDELSQVNGSSKSDMDYIDLLIEVWQEASVFGHEQVTTAVQELIGTMRAKHLNHDQRLAALNILLGVAKTCERTPAFSG